MKKQTKKKIGKVLNTFASGWQKFAHSYSAGQNSPTGQSFYSGLQDYSNISNDDFYGGNSNSVIKPIKRKKRS